MSRTVVIYARLSVASSEESVSLARQVEAGRKYAEARGWRVAAEFIDDGVSATHTKPEHRKGWRALLDSPEQFDAVIVWKIDRLARRVIDFLHADEALQERGAGLVAVEDPIDMTTPQGRAFATMLAVFGEMEAAAISARVAAARTHLVKAGRVVGGTVPFGWRSVPNPDGPGLVLALDPDAAPVLRQAVDGVLAGESVYSISKRLQKNGSTVTRLLRHPLIAGMTPFNPGNAGKVRGSEVLRDEHGLPVIDESIAIATPEERRRLLAILDDPSSPQRRPRASRNATSVLLAGLATCECGRSMHRATTQGRPSLKCSNCFLTITRKQLDEHVLERLLTERGNVEIVEWILTSSADPTRLAEIEEAVRATTAEMAEATTAEMPSLVARLATLKDMRADLRNAPSARMWRGTGVTVAEALADATDDERRREVLAGQVDRIEIRRGRVGRYLDPNRVAISWADLPVTLPDGTVLVEQVEPEGEGVIGPIVVSAGRERLMVG